MRICSGEKWLKHQTMFKVLYHIDSVCSGNRLFDDNPSEEVKRLHAQILNLLLKMDK